MTRSRGSAPSQRQLRVGEEIRHLLVQILGRGDLRDPALTDASITVTEVRVSPDLKNATAFVTPLGGGDMAAIVKACRRAAPYLRGQLAGELTLKFTPALSFVADTSFEQASRIDGLLADPRVARDLADDEKA